MKQRKLKATILSFGMFIFFNAVAIFIGRTLMREVDVALGAIVQLSLCALFGYVIGTFYADQTS